MSDIRPDEGGYHSPGRGALTQLITARAGRAVLLAGLAAQAGVFALVVLFAPQVATITASPAAAATWVGVLQAVTWAASLPGSRFWGDRSDRSASARRATGMLVPAAIVLAVVVALQAVPTEPWLLVPLRVLQGFAMAAVIPAVLHVTTRLVAEPVRGTAVGVSTGVLDLGQVIGPPAAALAITLLPAPAAFAVVASLFVVAGGLAALGGRRTPEVAT